MSTNASLDRGKKQNWDYVIRSGIAGGVAGCAAKTVVAPLDRVKILFQTSNPDFQKYTGSWSGALKAGSDIFKSNGFRGLLQGHSATLARVFPYAGIKFMAYDHVHHMLMPTRESETKLRYFAAGAISGTISVLFTYPLEVLRVRMAFDTHQNPHERPSFLRTFRTMYYESPPIRQATSTISTAKPTYFNAFPLLKFYRGFTVTIVGMVPYAGTSFLTWNVLRSKLIPPSPDGRTNPAPITNLAIGGISGIVSQTVSYPFEVVRRRMQVGGITRPDRWLRWGETVNAVWKANGWRGFYVGLSIGYLKVVPMTAVSYAVWQMGKRALGV